MRKVPFGQELTPLAGPIALVTTVDPEGRVNVAPKSWISHVCRQPNLLVLGCHREHHTARNLLASGECVLNFPSDHLARLTWQAHRCLEPAPDELAVRGFTPVPAERLVLCGPFGDGSGGMIVIRARSLEEAEAVGFGD